VISILAVLALVAAPYWGAPWGWQPSCGSSYGESVKGFVWIKEQTLRPGDKVEVGENVSYAWNGHYTMKRVWKVSADQAWIWVGGDNSGDGASSGSCEVGWIKLPGTNSTPPNWPMPNPKTVPHEPIVARGVVVGLWAPFDHRSTFEKQTRFFDRPQDIVEAGNRLILRGKEASRVYNRCTGELVREIPGYVTQCNGTMASFLQPTEYTGDSQQGQIDLETGRIQLLDLPRVIEPGIHQVDLRKAQITTTSRVKNPVNAFDGDSKTFWGVGWGSGQTDSIKVNLPESIKVHSIGIDCTLMYGTTLALAVQSRKGERAIQPGQVIDEVIDGFTITLRQHPVHQPVTGAIREVSIDAS